MRKILNTLSRNHQLIIASIICFTVVSGIIYSLYLGDRFLYYDEKDYFSIATSIAENHTYALRDRITAWRPPAYPFFLALFIKMGAGLPFLRILNFIALGANIYLISEFLKKQSPLASVLGACLVIGYPILFYTAGTLYPQTLIATLLIGTFILLHQPVRKTILIGIFLGILILMTPIYLFIVISCILWCFYYRPKDALILGLTAILVVAPWTIRNYIQFDKFVLVSTNGGMNLFIGNNENEMTNVSDILEKTKENHKIVHEDEVERDRFYRNKAIQYALNHPLVTIQHYGQKFLNHFSYWNSLSTKSQESQLKKVIMFVSYNFLLCIAILRLAFWRRFPLQPFEIMIVLGYIFFGAFQALFFTRIRFRIPFDYLLILLNANFLALLFARIKQIYYPQA